MQRITARVRPRLGGHGRRRGGVAAAVGLVAAVTACGAPVPDGLGRTADGTLSPCPSTPNCVHTGLRHPDGTRPIYLVADVELSELMNGLREVVEAMPRTVVVAEAGDYLHAEATSRLFRFIDDLELLVTEERELIVRSASRVGRSDMGVNGRRVEQLRAGLAEAGLLRS